MKKTKKNGIAESVCFFYIQRAFRGARATPFFRVNEFSSFWIPLPSLVESAAPASAKNMFFCRIEFLFDFFVSVVVLLVQGFLVRLNSFAAAPGIRRPNIRSKKHFLFYPKRNPNSSLIASQSYALLACPRGFCRPSTKQKKCLLI